MNAMTRLEQQEIETARIRALQALYANEDRALRNWALWVTDYRGIYPSEAKTGIYDQIKDSDRAGWADEDGEFHPVRIVMQGRVKAERAEREDYDEKAAISLNDRIHSPDLSEHLRDVLRVAYTLGSVPEYQFLARCKDCGNWDAFCERLERALRYAGRFV